MAGSGRIQSFAETDADGEVTPTADLRTGVIKRVTSTAKPSSATIASLDRSAHNRTAPLALPEPGSCAGA
jgi:hypothetical protein